MADEVSPRNLVSDPQHRRQRRTSFWASIGRRRADRRGRGIGVVALSGGDDVGSRRRAEATAPPPPPRRSRHRREHLRRSRTRPVPAQRGHQGRRRRGVRCHPTPNAQPTTTLPEADRVPLPAHACSRSTSTRTGCTCTCRPVPTTPPGGSRRPTSRSRTRSSSRSSVCLADHNSWLLAQRCRRVRHRHRDRHRRYPTPTGTFYITDPLDLANHRARVRRVRHRACRDTPTCSRVRRR